MRALVVAFVLVGRLLRFFSRILRKGQGTALSGWIIEQYFPKFLSYYKHKYTKLIVITGTNGKTTTRSLLVHFLRKSGTTVCTNSGGANIMRGIAASVLFDTNLFGSTRSEYLVLEVEEATLPQLVQLLTPDIFVLTNIARDQLDVYGEVDITRQYIQQAIKLVSEATVLINANDPQLLSLSSKVFGVVARPDAVSYEVGRAESVAMQEPVMQIEEKHDSQIVFVGKDITITGTKLIPGAYNLINYGLAIACAVLLDVNEKSIQKSLSSVEPVFSRQEEIKGLYALHRLVLVKNPMGFEAALADAGDFGTVVIGVNDNIADGRDVSWLWDVPFENTHLPDTLFVSGTRADDMALRLAQSLRSQKRVVNIEKIDIETLADTLFNSKASMVIFGTYTFQLQFRKYLGRKVHLAPISSDSY